MKNHLLLAVCFVGFSASVLPANDPISVDFVIRTRAYLGRGQIQSAFDELDEGIRRAPQSKHLYLMRCRLRFAMGKVTGALDDVNAALGHDIHNTSIRLLRCRILLSLDQPKKALEDAEFAVRTKPNQAAYLARSECYVMAGDLIAAGRELTTAINEWGESAGTHYMAGVLAFEKRDFAAVLRAFDGIGLHGQGARDPFAESLRAFGEAIRCDEGYAEAYAYRAKVLEQMNDIHGAAVDRIRASKCRLQSVSVTKAGD